MKCPLNIPIVKFPALRDDINLIMSDPTTPSEPAQLTFDQFRNLMANGSASCTEAEVQPIQGVVMVMPLVGQKAGKPFNAVATQISGHGIQLKAPHRLDIGQAACIRLKAEHGAAAWVQCVTREWELESNGCRIEADFVKVTCPHACNCPAFIFMRYGERLSCPHAGHSGCLQTGQVGAQVRELIAK
jgi:hypothetical protein